jgi:hypothetical protein
MESWAADLMDQAALDFLKIGDRSWERGRKAFKRGDIQWDVYNDIANKCRELVLHSMNISTAAVSLRLDGLEEHKKRLKKITEDIGKAKADLDKTEEVLSVVVGALAAACTLVAAVSAPTPVTIGAAVTAAANLVTAAN